MHDARAQSEIIGEILLVGVVVLVLSVAGAFVLGEVVDQRDVAYADVEATVEDGSLALSHRGGEPIPASDLRVRVTVNGTPATGVTWANGTVAGDGDTLFEIGERWTHPLAGVGAGSNARVGVTLAAVGDDGTGTVVYRDDSVSGRDGTAPPVGTPAPGDPPDADAGANRSVLGERGETVALDGTGTTEPDGDPVAYEWTVADADGISGSVDLRDADTPTPTLRVTQNVTDRDHRVRVRLRASDADGTTSDTTVVTVRTVGRPPTADAGPDRSVRGDDGANVTLDGTNSTDPDGDALSYDWRIVDDDGLPVGAVVLRDASTATPEFRVAENVSDRTHTTTVEVNVTDTTGRSDTERATVTVEERVETRVEATRVRGSAPLNVSLLGVAEGQPNEGVVDFSAESVEPYDPGGQDGDRGAPTNATVRDDGRALRLSGNAWKYISLAYDVSDRTRLRFDFRSPEEGEIHAIGFENDGQQSGERFYRLYGTQSYGRENLGYAGTGEYERFDVRVGPGYPSGTAQRLVFVTDEDTPNADAVSEFRDVIVYDEDGYTYEWDLDADGSYDDATGKQPEYTFSAPGSYEVRLRATAPDGRVGYANRTVRVDPSPTAAANASPPDPRVGKQVTLSGDGSSDPVGDGLTYDWDVDGDGVYEKSGRTVTHAYGSHGSRDVRLRVTDANGATDVDNVTVTVGSVVDAVDFGGSGGVVGGVNYRSDDGPPADGVSGGTTYSNDPSEPIANTTADAVYRTERYGDFDYTRGVANGTYRLRLQFAEIYFGTGNPGDDGGDGQRVFDVTVEGTERVSALDIHREVGPDAALVLTVTVAVDDRSLDVGFRTVQDNAKASGLVVERVDDG